MPQNNNQKGPSAAARLANLPLVRTACIRLSVLYTDTKSSHPKLRSVCEGLESGVTAIVSPVIIKLEPQISIANGVAWKSLDWLEMRFPVLQQPTEQVVASAKNKMHEIQEVVRIAASGTVDCVQHTVTGLMGRIPPADDQAALPLLERAVHAASMGLESALTMSEALVDRALPPTEEDMGESQMLVGFEEVRPTRSSLVRLVALISKLYRKTYLMATDHLSKCSGLTRDLQTSWQTLAWSIQDMPQYLQHQLLSMLFFFTQMYECSCRPSQQHRSNINRPLDVAEISTQRDVFRDHTRATPFNVRLRPIKTPAFDNECNVKGCVHR